MNKIQSLSTHLLTISRVLIWFLPAFAIFKWISIDTLLANNSWLQSVILQDYLSSEGAINLTTVNWSISTKLLAMLANLVALCPILIGIYALIKVFKSYQAGEIFNELNAKYYRLMGWMFIADSLIAKPLSEGLMTMAVSLNNAPGHRYISLSFGSPNIEALFCGMVLIVISWVMLEATRYYNEQKYTV